MGLRRKIFPYREHALVLYAARKLGRPVKWTGERSDCFLADTHGRDNLTEAELGLDRDGRFLAMRVATVANLGAYLSNFSTFIPTLCGTQLLVGVYDARDPTYSVKGVFTNTAPVNAYRGAGRPEAAYVIERMVDHAARKLGIPPDELRQRDFIAPAKMPYATTLGLTYDSGDFARNMEDALKLADAAGFPARKAAARKAGKRRGLGFSTYIEQCGGGPNEAAEVRFDPSGSLTLLVGTQASGQGHQTAYAQILAEALGVPFEEIRVVQGDSDQVAFGRGTGGSRSLPVGGAAVDLAAKRVIERGKPVAAHILEASAADIEFRDGQLSHRGHRPQRRHRASGGGRLRSAAPAARDRAGLRCHRALHPARLDLPQRLPSLRARGRPRDRYHAHRLSRAPICAPMVDPRAKISANTKSTVWFVPACITVAPAHVNRIWNRLVPTAT